MMKQFEQSELLKSLPKQFFASLVGKVGKVMAQGHDVINLGQGNPDQPTPSHIVETLQKQVLILCIINILHFGGTSF